MYCTDSLLDIENRQVQDITRTCLEKRINEGSVQRTQSKIIQPTKVTSSKASPTKSEQRHGTMDREGT